MTTPDTVTLTDGTLPDRFVQVWRDERTDFAEVRAEMEAQVLPVLVGLIERVQHLELLVANMTPGPASQ